MLRTVRAVALAFVVARASCVLAAPPGCIDRVRWGWPGYVIGKNPWGVVLSPSKSSDQGKELVNVCLSSTASSSAPPSSATTTTTSLSNVFVPAVTSELSSLTSLTSSTPVESSSTSVSIVTSSTTFEAPPTTSSTFEAPSSLSSVFDTTSVESPTEAPTPSTTTSSTPEPSPSSSSSSEPPAQTTTTNSFNSNPDNGGSDEGGSNGSQASGADVNEYLSAHNSIRAQHGASPLAWNNTLATAAQKWSNGCVFQHSGGSLGPFGENLAAGTGNAYGISSAVTSWTNEVSEYNPSNPAASHFTQVVWKGSTQLGCAETTCGGGTIFSDSSKYYVCEYFPQGNIIGAFAENVQA